LPHQFDDRRGDALTVKRAKDWHVGKGRGEAVLVDLEIGGAVIDQALGDRREALGLLAVDVRVGQCVGERLSVRQNAPPRPILLPLPPLPPYPRGRSTRR
jgi:hypothetical protein